MEFRVHFLGTSGFALIHQKEILIIDCYNPNTHALLTPASLSQFQKVTVLISHSHGDHYARAIWKLPNARFVAGYDVPAPVGVSLLRPGDWAHVNGLRVAAYGSTDEGVSFSIEWGEKTFFHAGDLNDWHWRDEAGAEYSSKAEMDFCNELAAIRAGIARLDIAFFPVDNRLGSDFYRGALLFAQRMRPTYFVPMHFETPPALPEVFSQEMRNYTQYTGIPLRGNIVLDI